MTLEFEIECEIEESLDTPVMSLKKMLEVNGFKNVRITFRDKMKVSK